MLVTLVLLGPMALSFPLTPFCHLVSTQLNAFWEPQPPTSIPHYLLLPPKAQS